MVCIRLSLPSNTELTMSLYVIAKRYAPFAPLSPKQQEVRLAREIAERLKLVPPLTKGNAMDTGN